ncbi:D-beta-hydroxybutyrate dehydrogenase, mitochondrial-like [Anneissia japonica]|uniref:D-beta-hydroxybutyrate dehydrogenase, mitochondrial-like n=1 Tax=Anneissia japonica TaxID=1529436 RepID=UPI001425974D|nr:D-beta-hydroxybutyrate dehydrogenase, mitochondrial-like [Anneissia japonica]
MALYHIYLLAYSTITLLFSGVALSRYLRHELELNLPSVLLLLLPMILQPLSQFILGGILGLIVFATACYYIFNNLPQGYLPVKEKAVLITGCDTGFGHGAAKHLDALGFYVFAGCLKKGGDGEQALVSECSNRLVTLQLDVTSDDQVKAALEVVKQHLTNKELWGLVNNAGVCIMVETEVCSLDMFQKLWEINCLGQVRMVKAFLPLLRRFKGRIVNVTSLCAQLYTPSLPAYCSSKAAAAMFTDVLRNEVKKWGINVSSIEPAGFKTAATTSGLMQQTITDMKERLPAELRPIYGDHYFNVMQSRLYKENDPRLETDLTSVYHAITHALLARRSKTRYVCGYFAPVLAWMFNHLPNPVLDFIASFSGTLVTKADIVPNGNKKSQTSTKNAAVKQD